MTEDDHAPACARSPLNVTTVVIKGRRYLLTRCACCGGQTLNPEPTKETA